MKRRAELYLLFTIPCLVLAAVLNWAGWLLNLTTLKQVSPGLASMHPVTALAFLLMGLGLGLLRNERFGQTGRSLAFLCAVSVLSMMVLNAAGFIWHTDIVLQHLMFKNAVLAAAIPPEISLATTVGLLAAAMALLLISLKSARYLLAAQSAAFFCLIVGLFGVFRYAVGQFPIGSNPFSHGFSVITACLLVALSLALLALRPSDGPLRYLSGDDLAGRLTRRMLFTTFAGTVIIGLLRISGEHYFQLYDSDTGVVLMATAMLCLFQLVVWNGGRWLRGAEEARIQAEADLRGAEHEKDKVSADLRLFFELSLDLLCIAGNDGYFKRVSPAFTSTLGWSAKELLSNPITFFIHPDDLDSTLKQIQKQAEHGQPVSDFENRYRCKDGRYRVLSWKSVPQPDGTRYAAARDVTDQIAINEALARERGMLKNFVETAADGIMTIDEWGTLLMVNQSALDMFGYTSDELLGQNIKMLMPEPFQSEHDNYLQKYRETGKKNIIGNKRDMQGLRKDGSEIPIELVVGEVVAGDSRVFTGIMRDSSERKEYEKALVDAMYEAKRANEAKSDFLSRMSHELRTPLNSVLGFAQVITMEFDDPKLHEMVGHISKGGEHLLELINEVLDIARIEAGRLAVSLEPVCAGDILHQAHALIEPIAREEGIAIRIREECSNVHVRADKQRLLQVFINLLSNAIKFNQPGGQVDIHCYCPDKGSCRIEVSDTGHGIAEEFHAQLFRPFERLGNESSPGTGLGLALSQQLVQLMGGDIELASTGPQGTTFAVVLNADSDPLTAADKGLTTRAVRNIELETGSKLLIIEDNLANLKLLEHVFSSWDGLKLISAMQGRIGLDMARQHRPDVVLLDLHLPDMDGDEVLRRLKADPKTRDIPVVILSADATPSQIKNLMSNGVHRYLTKPVNIPLLTETLMELFEQARTPGKG